MFCYVVKGTIGLEISSSILFALTTYYQLFSLDCCCCSRLLLTTSVLINVHHMCSSLFRIIGLVCRFLSLPESNYAVCSSFDRVSCAPLEMFYGINTVFICSGSLSEVSVYVSPCATCTLCLHAMSLLNANTNEHFMQFS